MRTLEEVVYCLNKDADTVVYDAVYADINLFSEDFKSKWGVGKDFEKVRLNINYRETLFPSCWKYFLYLKDITENCEVNYKKNEEDAIKIYYAIHLWCKIFRKYNKEIYWEYDETLHFQYLAIERFIASVEDMDDFLNNKERQHKVKFDLGATADKKGESKMKLEDQKDLLIFVKGIIEEVIDGIDVTDRNGKEIYSLANQTKEEIEEGLSTMEEFGNAYEELNKNLREDYLIRTNADKLKHILLDTYTKKNADYGDSFAESVAWFGYEAAFVRIYDKVMRYTSLEKKDPQVVSESKIDTLMDLANYCVMLYSILNNADYESSLRYIMNEFKNNAFAVQDTIMYSGDEPIGSIPSFYYIPVTEWKKTVEYWNDDTPELKDEVFKLAVSAIRLIVFEEVGIHEGN